MAELRVARDVLLRFRAGDREAFAQVVRAYGDAVRHIAARHWSGAFGQEEAMQEVWLKAYQQREALDPERLDQFAAWLGTLARRRCIDLLRMEARRPRSAGGLEADRDVPDSVEFDPERAVQVAELSAAVKMFRQRLDESWQGFFELHFVEGLGLSQISERLGLRPSRCKYLKREIVKRARRSPGLLAALGRFQRWRV